MKMSKSIFVSATKKPRELGDFGMFKVGLEGPPNHAFNRTLDCGLLLLPQSSPQSSAG